MLLKFEVGNYRSILQPVELSMIAVDADRSATRGFELLDERVLTVAGIYGPNASGKSNVVEALSWIGAAVARSLRSWDDFIPRETFRFGTGPGSPSDFEVEMVVGGVRHAYRLEVDDDSVLFEGLYSYPERRRRVLFERDGSDVRFRRGLAGAAGTRELLTPTTLALSAAMRLDDGELRAFGRALAGIRVMGVRRRGLGRPGLGGGLLTSGFLPTARLFDEKAEAPPSSIPFEEGFDGPNERESALALLRFADLGIGDVRVDEVSEEDAGVSPRFRDVRRQLRFVHRVADEEIAFDLEDESAGTQTWFRLIGPTLGALRAGRVLLFDEIDASLHPRLSARLLELFQDPVTNPLGAQLIFTTHDTSLLNHLNRDEVWLTEKGNDGATHLTALAEYGGDKVRRSSNLERAYLQGRFGAVPELDQFVLRRELGLAESGA